MFSSRYVLGFVIGVSVFGFVSCGSDKPQEKAQPVKAPQELWSALPLSVKEAGGETKNLLKAAGLGFVEFSASDRLHFEGYHTKKSEISGEEIRPSSAALQAHVSCWVPGNPDAQFQHRLEFNSGEINEQGIPVLSLLPMGVLERSVTSEQDFVTSCVMDFFARNERNQSHRFVLPQVLIRNLQRGNQIGIRKFAQDQDESRPLGIAEEELVHHSLFFGSMPTSKQAEIKLACLDFSLQQRLPSGHFQLSELNLANAKPYALENKSPFHRSSNHNCRLFLLENNKVTMSSQRFVLRPQIAVPLLKPLPITPNLVKIMYEFPIELENPYAFDLPIQIRNLQGRVRNHSVGIAFVGMGLAKVRYVFDSRMKAKLTYQGVSRWLGSDTLINLRGKSIAKLILLVPLDPCRRIPAARRGDDVFEFFEMLESGPTVEVLHSVRKNTDPKNAVIGQLALLHSGTFVLRQGLPSNSIGAALGINLGGCTR